MFLLGENMAFKIDGPSRWPGIPRGLRPDDPPRRLLRLHQPPRPSGWAGSRPAWASRSSPDLPPTRSCTMTRRARSRASSSWTRASTRKASHSPTTCPGETIQAKFVVLAEGCDGLVTERFVEKAGLKRKSPQLFSVGVKELIKVSPEQYNRFGPGRVVHAMGYPIWTPVLGPGMFGGGIVYAGEQDHLAVGMIVGLGLEVPRLQPAGCPGPVQGARVRQAVHRGRQGRRGRGQDDSRRRLLRDPARSPDRQHRQGQLHDPRR